VFIDSNEAQADKIVRTNSIEKIRSLSQLKLAESSHKVEEEKKK